MVLQYRKLLAYTQICFSSVFEKPDFCDFLENIFCSCFMVIFFPKFDKLEYRNNIDTHATKTAFSQPLKMLLLHNMVGHLEKSSQNSRLNKTLNCFWFCCILFMTPNLNHPLHIWVSRARSG